MTSATAPTCSAPTSAPAGPISSTASRNARAPAQAGGLGIIVYNRKEGRALGEVTKFLVYNARKRQEGGDAAAQPISSAPNASPACRTRASSN